MNGSRSGPREHAEAVGPEARDFAGKVRRMLVTRTSSPRYQVTGHTLLEGNIETRDAEVFQGVGFYALPADDGDTEAIVAFVGGPGNPIIVGIRQEAVRRAMAADMSADETQVHNSKTLIRIKRNGTVEIRRSTPLGPVESTIKADTYRTSEDVLLTALGVLAAAISTFAGFCVGPTSPQLTALTGAVTTFATALGVFLGAGATYKTTVLKAE